MFEEIFIPKLKNIVQKISNHEKEIYFQTIINQPSFLMELKSNHSIIYQREADPYTPGKNAKKIDAILKSDNNMAFIEYKKSSNTSLSNIKKLEEQLSSYDTTPHNKPTHRYLIIFMDKFLSNKKKEKIKNCCDNLKYEVIYIDL